MSDQWHLSRNGEVFGPYSSEQLHELAQGGRVHPNDMVYCETTPHWYPAAEIQGLFPSVPLAQESPVESPDTVPFDEDMGATRRRRRRAEAANNSQLYWMLPVGGAFIMGILTLVVMLSGRGKKAPPPDDDRPPPRKTPPRERDRTPPVERPETPVDYSLPKLDYTKGPRGEAIDLRISDFDPAMHFTVFLDKKGKEILHGAWEECHSLTGVKSLEVWWYDDKLNGPIRQWDEIGHKVLEGQYSLGRKHGKWVRYHPRGQIASEAHWYRGKKHGTHIEYHTNGKKARAVAFRHDRRTAPGEYWDDRGKPLSPDVAMEADLKPASYEEMIDILGPPGEVHESRGSKGDLYLWKTGKDHFVGVWVRKDKSGKPIKGKLAGVGLSQAKVDELKRGAR